MSESSWPQGTGRAPRPPDSTDPDLAPLPPDGPGPAYGEDHPPALTGQIPAYADDTDYDDDDEPVEDGLRENRGPVQAVAERSRRPRDMVISIGVLVGILLVLFGVYSFLGGGDSAAIDPGPTYAEARAAAAFPVLEPKGLSDDWKPVRALYQPQQSGAELRVGYETPDGGSVQLIEGSLPPEEMLRRELGGERTSSGNVDVGGRSWESYPARTGEKALVLREPGRTVIVVGKASEDELKQLAGSLK
ncbi:hypothetical protein Val02_69630 [Virgisporangium aliadipatigenens]|uniref:DUF4245 domain-containing protein n=1 Tax=Virgisporangium aliadipatigenens TaxID=741659 RepID=A0A8J3YTB4_9ACTN|nr:DUF4245 domain-containing protein [Virgisporangium aliadipatigenens]GIJ50077.1 hypothetical protein Val02_69630 [Virgisporangium aliadipatigenens]